MNGINSAEKVLKMIINCSKIGGRLKKSFISLSLLLLAFSGMIMQGCDVDNKTAPDTRAPEVIVTYPGNWATIYDEQFTLSLEVSDENAIDSVSVVIDGEFYAELFNDPFQIVLSKSDFTDGQHTIYAVAADDQSNIGMSDLLNFFWLQEEQQSQIDVEIVRPVLWEKFVTSQVPVQVNVESMQEIDNVAIYLDGIDVHDFTQIPYETVLDVTQQGTHNIFVIVTDNLGYSKISSLINFEVEYIDLIDPNGFIAYPADWTNITGIFEARIIAFDDVEVDRVELFVDGVYWNESDDAPYNFEIDSTMLSNENHTLYAIIYDSSENSFVTQLVNIRIEN